MSLSTLILILLAGGAIAWFSERWGPDWPRRIALLTLLIDLFAFIQLCTGLPVEHFSVVPNASAADSWLLHEVSSWIPRFGIQFEFALDGLSVILVALTLFLGIIAVLSSWAEITERRGFFQANVLWTLAGVVGVFLAMDLFLFFLFWEVMLVPMYLLIAIWGHEGRAYASMKFFIFTQFSGLLLLAAIVLLATTAEAQNGSWSFSYFTLLDTQLQGTLATAAMLGFLIAFVVKLPGFPFHTWLPDAHTQAPTAGSVILAGILLKTGAYGLMRFTVPLFPEASADFAPIAMGLGVAGVLYGALLALAQTDFKRLVAYSSVSHMGFVLIGVFAWNTLALQGAVIQMVAHGLSTSALFMIAGALQHRMHTRDMRRMGGLWSSMPKMGASALFFAIASVGLPGLGNFIAEFLVLIGVFAVSPLIAALAALGMVTGAAYMLWMLQQAFYGEGASDLPLRDFDVREMLAMAMMMIGLLWLGLMPQFVLELAAPVLKSLAVVVAGG